MGSERVRAGCLVVPTDIRLSPMSCSRSLRCSCAMVRVGAGGLPVRVGLSWISMRSRLYVGLFDGRDILVVMLAVLTQAVLSGK